MLEFLVLGPLQVRRDGRVLELAGAKARALLVALLARANEPVSQDRLIEELWGEQAPAGARKALQMQVSRVRHALRAGAGTDEPEFLLLEAAGYRLIVAPAAVDATRCRALVDEARELLAAGRPARARDRLDEALAMWRGPPLADLAYESYAQQQIAQLEELRLAALEARADADLALGRHLAAVGELRRLIGEHPLRERFHAQMMLALYRSGRQADALAAYRHARTILVDELGIEPGHELRELERAILTHDPALDLPSPGAGSDACANAGRLPSPPTPTIGRDQDVARLRDLLSGTRLLTLVGVGGIGKTRLAVVLADTVAGDYEDGVRFVSLADAESADVIPTTVAASLGVASLPGEPAFAALCRLIGDKRMLVVADNFEHVLAAADLIGELIDACPGLCVVATSREPLRLSGEQLYAVGPLALPERTNDFELASIRRSPAIQLFVDRAGARDAGFVLTSDNAAAVAQICVRLDGLPLAIELAAAHTTLLAPAELATRLDDALGVLVDGPRDVPARQRTLRATLDWSHALLEASEQRAFADLAAFSGGCTLVAAESVTGLGVSCLEKLVTKSLLSRAGTSGGEARIRMLEPVRAYALEQLEARADADSLRDRHCEYYTRLAERAESALLGHDQATWVRRLDADRANFRTALVRSLQAERPELGLRLGSALARHMRGHAPEIRDALRAALSSANDVEPLLHAKAHLALSHLIGGGPGALEHSREAVRLFRAQADPHGTAEALIALSVDVDSSGDPHRAAELAAEALALAQTTGDQWLIARALDAQLLGSPESFAQARHLAERGLAIMRRLGDRIKLATALANFGYSAITADETAVAIPAFDEAIALLEDLEHDSDLCFVLVGRGLALVLHGRDEQAAGDFARALARCGDTGQPMPVAEGLTGLAAIAARRGDTELVARLAGAADAQRLFEVASSTEQRLQHEVIDRARARADGQQWERGWTRGTALSFDQAIALGVAAGIEINVSH